MALAIGDGCALSAYYKALQGTDFLRSDIEWPTLGVEG
jgi:hypothetical protein